MSAHNRRGARLGAMLLWIAFSATPLLAHAQAASRAWSTYLGGSGNDRVTSILMSPVNRDVVVAGWTNSRDFPPRTGTGNDPARDAFISVFTAEGLIRGSPFIFGSTGEDLINAVAIGSQGQIYAVGMTRTADMSPFFTNRYRTYGGLEDAFLARFTSDGAPEWIMYLDSPGTDMATGVTVSGTDIYVTGFTDTCAFMGVGGSCAGGREGFVVKVSNATATPSVTWTTLILGNLDDFANKPLVSGSSVVVAGTTSSTAFSHGSAVQNFFQGGTSDAMAVGLDAASGAVSWLQYVGGVGEDNGAAVVPGANGGVVLVGTTEVAGEGKNIFATRINSAGQQQGTQRYGGTDDEVVSSAAVDSSGNIYIGGRTRSTDFPLAREFDRTTEPVIPPQEGFVMVLPALGGPGWASYVGGNGMDDVLSLSIHQKRLVMAGETTSSSDLVTGGGYDSTLSTPPDGFIVAVDTDITPPVPGIVNDRPTSDDVAADISTQTSRDTISANWSGFVDSESGVDRYEWAIGTSPGAQDVVPFTPTTISIQSSFTKTGLTLIVGRTYYTTVRAINGAGLTITASSNGVLVVPVETDGGTNGGTDGGVDGGTDGGTNGGTDGGTGEEPEEGTAPLIGWSCTAADAGLPMLAGLLALVLLARRRGSQSR